MKLCAVIIESRSIPNLEQIIRSHMDMLPECTPLFFVHGSQNEHLKHKFNWCFGTKLVNDNLTENEYNNMLTRASFWESFLNYDRVLVFQSDSMLLRKGIEYFYDFNYVGSPWAWQSWGGNGGLSLRNPKVMKDICEMYTYDQSLFGNEDVFFCNMMQRHGMNLATREVCQKFACEAIFEMGTLGYHAIEKHLTPEQCQQIINQYKSVSSLQ